MDKSLQHFISRKTVFSADQLRDYPVYIALDQLRSLLRTIEDLEEKGNEKFKEILINTPNSEVESFIRLSSFVVYYILSEFGKCEKKEIRKDFGKFVTEWYDFYIHDVNRLYQEFFGKKAVTYRLETLLAKHSTHYASNTLRSIRMVNEALCLNKISIRPNFVETSSKTVDQFMNYMPNDIPFWNSCMFVNNRLRCIGVSKVVNKQNKKKMQFAFSGLVDYNSIPSILNVLHLQNFEVEFDRFFQWSCLKNKFEWCKTDLALESFFYKNGGVINLGNAIAQNKGIFDEKKMKRPFCCSEKKLIAHIKTKIKKNLIERVRFYISYQYCCNECQKAVCAFKKWL